MGTANPAAPAASYPTASDPLASSSSPPSPPAMRRRTPPSAPVASAAPPAPAVPAVAVAAMLLLSPLAPSPPPVSASAAAAALSLLPPAAPPAAAASSLGRFGPPPPPPPSPGVGARPTPTRARIRDPRLLVGSARSGTGSVGVFFGGVSSLGGVVVPAHRAGPLGAVSRPGDDDGDAVGGGGSVDGGGSGVGVGVGGRVEGKSDDGDGLSHDEIERYSRHLVLSSVGTSGQLALRNSAVLVVGAGGLGSPCLLYLAAAGVGHIGIVDADTVDTSNLQRQIIHGTSTVGITKCESARRRIEDVNPHVKVRTYEEELTSETAMRMLGDGFSPSKSWDCVVDGSDNFPTKYLINDACELTGLPWVYGAILAFEGQVSVFNHPPGVGPTYRDMMPTPPPPGDVPSCAEGGVLGVLPGAMGCLQATEVIKIVLGKTGGLLRGRVLTYDALDMRFGEVGLEREEDREAIAGLIDYQGFCAGHLSGGSDTAAPAADATRPPAEAGGGGRTMDEVEEAAAQTSTLAIDPPSHRTISPTECLERLSSGWTPYVLDVRLRTEADIVSLPFTDSVVPHRTVRSVHVPREGDVLVYCKAGVRGRKACDRLRDMGVDSDRLYNLGGGIMGWRREVDPSMPKY